MEARFAEGVWLGKSEFDDSHLVADTRIGIQTVRTARRMPIEFRWRGDLVANISATPWNLKPGTRKEVAKPSWYITESMIDWHGPTDDCNKCSTGKGPHPEPCRQRFEKIQADLLAEKLAATPVEEADKDASGAGASSDALAGAPEGDLPKGE